MISPKYAPLLEADSLWKMFLMPAPTLAPEQIERLTVVRKYQYLADLHRTEKLVNLIADRALRDKENKK